MILACVLTRAVSAADRIAVPLWIDDRQKGEYLIEIRKHDLLIDASVLQTLGTELSSETLKALASHLENTADKKTWISSETFRHAHLKFIFDEKTVAVHVSVPAKLKAKDVISMHPRPNAPEQGAVQEPSPFGGYLNLHAADQYFLYHSDTNGGHGRRPIQTAWDGAINIRSWVLEGAATYQEEIHPHWARQDLRLVKDFPSEAIRASFGDVTYPVQGYERFVPAAGIVIAKNYSLQPYRVTIPTGHREIFLKSPSIVKVRVNGALIQTLNLSAGRHELQDLTQGSGIHDVEIEVMDASGQLEKLVFPWATDASLLAPSTELFAYSAGIASQPIGSHYAYDLQRPVGSLSHSIGITEHWTAGGFLQAAEAHTVGGTRLYWGSSFGIFGLEPAISFLRTTGFASKLTYHFLDFSGAHSTQRSFDFGAEYLSKAFAPLDVLSANNPQDFLLEAGYAQELIAGIGGRISEIYQHTRPAMGSSNVYGTSLAFYKGFDNGMQLSLNLTQRRASDGQLHRDATFFLNWAIPSTNHFLTLSHDTEAERSRLDWRYTGPQQVGQTSVAVGAEKAPTFKQADLQIDYTANRALVGITHSTLSPDHQQTYHTSGVKIASALAFAVHDGVHFSLSRPIADSFGLVYRNDALSNQTIGINSLGQNQFEAQTDWLGPAVVPSVRSYQPYALYLDPSFLEPGLDLGQENYLLHPSYKSGFAIQAGHIAAVTWRGTLLDPFAKPMALISGEVLALNDRSFPESYPFFTNRKGEFTVEGLYPGSFQLVISEAFESFRFKIPPQTKGLYDTGQIRLKALGK